MYLDAWQGFLADVSARYGGRSTYFSEAERARFVQFVAGLAAGDRVPLLLHAYDRYRVLSKSAPEALETSCNSVLISVIFSSKIAPTAEESIEILKRSFHCCGHGTDVEPPLELAFRAFDKRPFTTELFDAVATYKEALRASRGVTATKIKAESAWVLWHDVRKPEKGSWTAEIQKRIFELDEAERFQWQWLLRNVSASMNAAPGKAWVKEAGKRLEALGKETFLRRVEEWLVFPETPVKLSPTGSNVLRLLIWYADLADRERALPTLMRMARAHWTDEGPAGKVMGALARVLQEVDGSGYLDEIKLMCEGWAAEISEIGRLEEKYLADRAAARQRAREAKTAELAKGNDIAGLVARLVRQLGSEGPKG